MPSAAGQLLEAGRIPGERIATTRRTSSSAAFSAETVVDTVVADLVDGRRYRITWDAALSKASGTSNSDGYTRCRIREDNISGAQLQLRQRDQVVPAGQAFPVHMEAEYDATASAAKTFVVTVIRQAGTSGDITANAAADTPTYLYVDYIEDV